MAEDFVLTGGVSSSTQKEVNPSDLAPNNYLTIVWKDVNIGDLVKALDIDYEKAMSYTNQLNNAIDNAISNNNVSYVAQNRFVNLESIGKYIAQNTISNSSQLRVVR